MILIAIPTLDPDQGLDTGRRAQASAAYDTRLVVVHDEKGEGFTKTANRGLRQREPGEDVCLLNDDIITFNYGWLKILAAALRTDSRRGIVGPSGKSAGPAKHGALGGYDTQTVGMLPFWCVLINHKLLDQLGYLNEALIHYSSDTLYCYEARKKGWHSEWVKPVYLWHRHQGSGFRQDWRDRDTETFKRLIGGKQWLTPK
jgi:GT2 family glycosyltransferase